MSKTLMRFTGVGGQGVLLAGEIFAAAKIKTGGFGLKTAHLFSAYFFPSVLKILQPKKFVFATGSNK